MRFVKLFLFFLIMICSGYLFANVPNDPGISGPTRVMAGLQNVAYSLDNFNQSGIISCIWYLENTSTHVVTTNIVTSGSLSTIFDMPNSQATLLLDVEVSYYDSNLDQEVIQIYTITIKTFLITLHNVRRVGIDGNNYLGPEANVPIHFNIDNDVRDNNSDFWVTRPTPQEDNDLLPMTFELYPANVFMGNSSVLEIEVTGAGARLWSDQHKSILYSSSGNNYIYSNNDLYSIENITFYVEAIVLGASYIKVYINGEQIDSSMRYNAYAVTEGKQPTWLQQSILEYQTLIGCEWSLIFPLFDIVSSYLHSSLAYAVDPGCQTFGVPFIVQETTPRTYSNTILISSNYFGAAADYTNVDAFGNNDGLFDINDVIAYFESTIWPINYDLSGYSSNGDIIYYSEFHAARKHSNCSGARPSWHMYKSKYTAGTIFIYRDYQLNEGSIWFHFNEEVAK